MMNGFLIERRFGPDAALPSILIDPLCFERIGGAKVEGAVAEQLAPVVRILLGSRGCIPPLALVVARDDWRSLRDEHVRSLERSVAKLGRQVAVVIHLDDTDEPGAEVTLDDARRRIRGSAASLCDVSALIRRGSCWGSVLLVGWWHRDATRDSTVFVIEPPPCAGILSRREG